jgi:hypothetical protein
LENQDNGKRNTNSWREEERVDCAVAFFAFVFTFCIKKGMEQELEDDGKQEKQIEKELH